MRVRLQTPLCSLHAYLSDHADVALFDIVLFLVQYSTVKAIKSYQHKIISTYIIIALKILLFIYLFLAHIMFQSAWQIVAISFFFFAAVNLFFFWNVCWSLIIWVCHIALALRGLSLYVSRPPQSIVSTFLFYINPLRHTSFYGPVLTCVHGSVCVCVCLWVDCQH